jgi:lanthanide-dependent methanol dehydrogenase
VHLLHGPGVLFISVLLVGCEERAIPPVPGAANAQERTPRAGADVDANDDGQWLLPARNHQNTRFSGMSDIDRGNVDRLQVAWTFSTGVLRGHEAAPIVVGDTMYVVTPYPNLLHALDLNRNGAKKWTFDPKVVSEAQGVACCDVVNRGAAYAGGKVFFNTLDNHTVAVDASTGKQVWKTKLGDISRGETMTMAPLAAKGKVFVGNSGGELGVRGWVTALDQQSGAIAWRAYHTGPDADVLIGEQFKPFYEQDRGKDLGVTTWPQDLWKIGGGTVWGWISYDPDLDLVYYGTANPGPWNPDQRKGDNKWTATIFARRPDSGQAVWAYQWMPHDQHDYDGVNENVVLDLQIDGRMRKVIVHPSRNGFLYVLDRSTGEVVSASPFEYTNVIKEVDLKTGRPVLVPGKETAEGRNVRNICPAAPGAKDWQPASWSPRTQLLYVPTNHLCMDFKATRANYIAGTPYVGAEVTMHAGPGGHRGTLTAWDVSNSKALWSIKERFPVWSGVLATAGDVVFYGTMDRWFKAVDARSGKLLWQYQVGSGIVGQTMTYRGPDGRQYVAVLSGVGGWAGAIVAGELDARDGTAALGFVNAMKDLPQHTQQGGTLYVFALPGAR